MRLPKQGTVLKRPFRPRWPHLKWQMLQCPRQGPALRGPSSCKFLEAFSSSIRKYIHFCHDTVKQGFQTQIAASIK